eukprot:3912327-Rhodomonas_salina.1
MAQVSSNIQSPFPNTSRLFTAELHTVTQRQRNRQLERPGSSQSTHTHKTCKMCITEKSILDGDPQKSPMLM